jgi:hypothetical protein
MEVALIDPYGSIKSPTTRQLSSCLKRVGHEVKLIFMPAYPRSHTRIHFAHEHILPHEPYTEQSIADLRELCANCGLIGITLMAPFFSAVRQITANLRRHLAIPIVWGGIHPTVCAEECLNHTDMICVGEGDSALPELAAQLEAGSSAETVKNIWYRRDGENQRNPIRPWLRNMDELPVPDCDTTGHYALSPDRSRVVWLDEAF